jgi:SAM-dependent methyltransferase
MQYSFELSTIKELIAYSLRGPPGPDAWHITRAAMYKALRDKLRAHDAADRTCLAISDSVWFGKILGLKQCRYTPANYPEHNILDLTFADGSFDFVISDQVFEHIEGDPFVAFRETARVLRAGGMLCHTTCFINEIHASPRDFWRFTPDALALLARHAGCEVVLVGAWGNREAWALINAGFRWAKIPADETHPLYQLAMRNEPQWPIVTWIIARKT